MTVIYLIRHAEAEGNLYRRIQGHWNGQVTPRGQKQIDALAERFREVEIDAVWSSDLQRTMDTAGAILKYHDLTLETTPRLREVCLGVWEGRPWGDVEYEMPEQMFYFNHDPARWIIPKAERYEAAQARMKGVLAEIAKKHEGQTVAAVSHGMAIRVFLAAVLGIPSAEIDRLPHGDNTAVACLKYDGDELTVEYYNDASHLPEDLSTLGRQTWWKGRDADAGNLRFEPLQFPRDSAFFDACYSDAWAAAHGSTAGYTARPYLRSAKEHARTPHAVVKLLSGDKVVGMIDMDPDRGRAEGYGWISFFYLLPEYRGKGWAAQLLGHALWFSESHGRRSVRLHVAEDNTHARGFYEHFGFQKIGETPGIRGTLYQMEKVIGAR
ncbi:MAG: GNAT family N-acetyltransferase [Oscillospiraceae bacterium]|nr:GNAT family N-acetyltransferase [Oscillospiraceae bacterium]